MLIGARKFDEVWCVDFEFRAPDGEIPAPLCLVAREIITGRIVRLWLHDEPHTSMPFVVGPRALFVAYYASAEVGCILELGWPVPPQVLDLFAEFRVMTNGVPTPCGAGLLGALAYFGLDGIGAMEKEGMRELALRGGPYSPDERRALLDYCQSDVDALARLLPAMAARLDIGRALLRGRYMVAAARIERHGMPIDKPLLGRLLAGWDDVKHHLVRRVDEEYGLYEGTTFRSDRFAAWLASEGIPWPRLPTGRLALDEDTFREMARSHPGVAPLHELRSTLSKLRLSSLAVGSDGRNRTLLSAFRATTGRNQPSTSKFIFGPSAWIRCLIRPPQDHAVAYVDWSQQEFGIGAALSGDSAMTAAYLSGDPYLAFAKQARAVPADATKDSHGAIRDLFKTCALGVQYAMGEKSLAERIGRSTADARELLDLHRQTYHRFWKWSDAAVDQVLLHGRLWTTFGWELRTGPLVNPRSVRNFPMQANGAEMLRLACIIATERGIQVCAPVHDALMIEAPLDQIDDAVRATQESMAEASRIVLGGMELRSDVKVFRYPDRYMDERGGRMWQTVMEILSEVECSNPSAQRATA